MHTLGGYNFPILTHRDNVFLYINVKDGLGGQKFHLTDCFALVGHGVIHKNGELSVSCLHLPGANGEERLIEFLIEHFQRAIGSAQSAFLAIRTTGAAENIVESNRRQCLLRLLKCVLIPSIQTVQLCQSAQLFSRKQLIFQLNMLLLDGIHRGISAQQAGHGLIVYAFRGYFLHKGLRCAVHHGKIHLLYIFCQIRKVLTGGIAAVVAHAPKCRANLIIPKTGCFFPNVTYRISVAGGIKAIAVGTKDLYFAAILAHPSKYITGQINHIGQRTANNAAHIAAFRKNLGQTYTVTKAVKIDGYCGTLSKLLLKILPSQLNLAHKCLAGGHIAIGLQIPAAHNMPLALCHQLLDALKKDRIVLLNELIQNGFVVAENIIVFIAKLSRLIEGGNGSTKPFFPIPHPYRIYMRITD